MVGVERLGGVGEADLGLVALGAQVGAVGVGGGLVIRW